MATTSHVAASASESKAQLRRMGESLLERIGNTPLLRLERVGREFPNVEFCAKAEWFNPGGSVKDRPALSMIQAGVASGALRPGKTLIDGTSGTFVGTTRRLKELNPEIRCVSLQPDASFHGLEGWKHMPTAIRPAIYDDRLADENLEVSTEAAYRLVKRLAREEGLLVSPSSAAALLGCFEIASRIPKQEKAVTVTVFADSASKYLNERFWDEE